jgi:hypothetical protein
MIKNTTELKYFMNEYPFYIFIPSYTFSIVLSRSSDFEIS